MKKIINICFNNKAYLFYLIFSGITIFFVQCTKDILPGVKSEPNKLESKSIDENDVKEFHKKMMATRKGEILEREGGTSTFEDIIPIYSESMGYYYSHPERIDNQMYTFIDTISIEYSSVDLTSKDEVDIYDVILTKIRDQHARCSADSVFFMGVSLYTATRGSTSGTMVVQSTFADNHPRNSFVSFSGLPGDRYFGNSYNCDWSVNYEDQGAAAYLISYLNRMNPIVGPDNYTYKYLGQIKTYQTQYYQTNWTTIFWSLDLFNGNKTVNSTDPTPNDNSIDHWGFYAQVVKPLTLDHVTCITPTEYAYHAPKTNIVIHNELDNRSMGSFLYIDVKDAYHDISGNIRECYWGYWLTMCNVRTSVSVHVPLAMNEDV